MMKIQIPEPCHQDWGKMSIEAQGRFCTSCQKKVVDFTHMSDDEVKNYLLKNQQQKTCGHFLSSQIDRPLENKTIVLSETWYAQLPYARQVFYAVALFFVLGVSACNWDNTAQTVEKIPTSILTGAPRTVVGESQINTAIEIKPTVAFHPPIQYNTKDTLTGDIAINEPILQGAPLILPDSGMTIRAITAKIVIDTIAKESKPFILGGIGLSSLPDSTIH